VTAADGWLGGRWERLDITGCTGPGTMADGYAWRFVMHTTESPRGTINGVLDLFRGRPCSCPQLIYDPGDPAKGRPKRFVQCVPWTWAGSALKGRRNGVETNRARAVQIEIVGRAEDSPGWPDSDFRDLAEIVADLIRDGCPIDPTVYPDYPVMKGWILAAENARQRMSPDVWRNYPGLAGHVVAPFQDHWDPGRFDAAKLSAYVLESLGQAAPARTAAPAAPPPAAAAPAPNTLRRGMVGGLVKAAQEALVAAGYNVGPTGPDGDFGPSTEGAVRALQRDAGLTIDGLLGPLTEAALRARLGLGPGARRVSPPWPGRYLLLTNPFIRGDDVRQWQARAAQIGFSPGPADGIFGPRSRDAAYRVQAARGQTEDGKVGPATWAATFS
jgi:peptidoglycan hydrolase-like protein with peptidoglycan-binding domain